MSRPASAAMARVTREEWKKRCDSAFDAALDKIMEAKRKGLLYCDMSWGSQECSDVVSRLKCMGYVIKTFGWGNEPCNSRFHFRVFFEKDKEKPPESVKD